MAIILTISMYIALEWAVENDSQLILNDARVQRVIEVCIFKVQLCKCKLSMI